MKNIKDLFDEIKLVQNSILEYLENGNDIEEKFQILTDLINDQNIRDDHHQVRLIIHLLIQIANNHNREFNLYDKIKKVLLLFKEEIKKYFYNFEIFNIAKYNKSILLFLIEEELLIVDNYFISSILKENKQYMNYIDYFLPEIQSFIKSNPNQSNLNKILRNININIPQNYDNNRQKGENINYICQLIREDLIEEFIIYVNKKDISLNTTIIDSIFETNIFLIKSNQEESLIEYAAFFGSIQIFKYLFKNGCELTSSLWLYSIHSNNPEMIHFLEEQKVKPKDETYVECYIEAIKCHHNDIAKYIKENYIQHEYKEYEILLICLQYYNFEFIEFYDIIMQLYYLSKFDHSLLIYHLPNIADIVNQTHWFYYKNPSEKKAVNDNDKYKIKAAKTGIIDIDESSEYKEIKTALIIAIEKENIEIVKLLLSKEKIDANIPKKINADGFKLLMNIEEPALFVAVAKGNNEIIKLLLENEKVDPNLLKIKNLDGSRDGECVSLLYEVIEKGNIDVLKILLNSKRIDPNIYSYVNTCKHYSMGKTALHFAVEKNNIDVVKILLKSDRIDPNLYTINGQFSNDFCLDQNAKLLNPVKQETALHIANRLKNTEIAELLLSHKDIKPNETNYYQISSENLLYEILTRLL